MQFQAVKAADLGGLPFGVGQRTLLAGQLAVLLLKEFSRAARRLSSSARLRWSPSSISARSSRSLSLASRNSTSNLSCCASRARCILRRKKSTTRQAPLTAPTAIPKVCSKLIVALGSHSGRRGNRQSPGLPALPAGFSGDVVATIKAVTRWKSRFKFPGNQRCFLRVEITI
jgi:hypothetical protein